MHMHRIKFEIYCEILENLFSVKVNLTLIQFILAR